MRKLFIALVISAFAGCGSQSQPTSDVVDDVVDECPVEGSYTCRGNDRIVCSEGDGRLVWVTAATCSNGCAAGKCVEGATCADECADESVAGCGGDKRMVCVEGDGCLVWAVAADCAFGCEGARCKACVPDCIGLECGSDPVCGTSCGNCGGEETCNNGVCQGPCEPDCTGLQCGNDPVCGTSCGTCGAGRECEQGVCKFVQTSCDESPAQGLSQPCCLKYGVDACGAGLFCAAFDGRTVPTCYVERVRTALQECWEDLHCLSSSCNLETQKCRSLYNEKCTPATGCMPYNSSLLVCDATTDTSEGKCDFAGSEVGDLCLEDSGCDTGYCSNRRCVEAGIGQNCVEYTDCSSRHCVNGKCTTGVIGAPCTSDDSCEWNLYCGTEGSADTGKCVEGAVGDPCNLWESLCVTDSYKGYCYDAGNGGHCYAGAAGDPCGNVCNAKNMVVCEDNVCVQKLATGRKCTADGDCFNYKSGEYETKYDYDQICDPTKKVCLRTYGGYCTSTSQCATGECDQYQDYCHY